MFSRIFHSNMFPNNNSFFISQQNLFFCLYISSLINGITVHPNDQVKNLTDILHSFSSPDHIVNQSPNPGNYIVPKLCFKSAILSYFHGPCQVASISCLDDCNSVTKQISYLSLDFSIFNLFSTVSTQ